MASAFEDIGPTAPPRWQVYDRARAIGELAQRARELATEGRGLNLPEAMECFERIRALLPQNGAIR